MPLASYCTYSILHLFLSNILLLHCTVSSSSYPPSCLPSAKVLDTSPMPLRLEISPCYTQHTIATHCHTGIDATSLHSMFVSSVLSVSDISPQLLQEISIILHHVLDGHWSNVLLQAPILWHISVIINLYTYVHITSRILSWQYLDFTGKMTLVQLRKALIFCWKANTSRR